MLKLNEAAVVFHTVRVLQNTVNGNEVHSKYRMSLHVQTEITCRSMHVIFPVHRERKKKRRKNRFHRLENVSVSKPGTITFFKGICEHNNLDTTIYMQYR